jgi:hypothetical protein
MKWFSAFLNEVTNEREYKQTFDRTLTNLFDGFPGDLFASFKRDVDLDDLMRLLRADGNTARESAVYAAIALISWCAQGYGEKGCYRSFKAARRPKFHL